MLQNPRAMQKVHSLGPHRAAQSNSKGLGKHCTMVTEGHQHTTSAPLRQQVTEVMFSNIIQTEKIHMRQLKYKYKNDHLSSSQTIPTQLVEYRRWCSFRVSKPSDSTPTAIQHQPSTLNAVGQLQLVGPIRSSRLVVLAIQFTNTQHKCISKTQRNLTALQHCHQPRTMLIADDTDSFLTVTDYEDLGSGCGLGDAPLMIRGMRAPSIVAGIATTGAPRPVKQWELALSVAALTKAKDWWYHLESRHWQMARRLSEPAHSKPHPLAHSSGRPSTGQRISRQSQLNNSFSTNSDELSKLKVMCARDDDIDDAVWALYALPTATLRQLDLTRKTKGSTGTLMVQIKGDATH